MTAETVRRLEAISRRRPLSDRESRQLEKALRASEAKNTRWHWTPFEDAKVLALMEKRARRHQPKPFTRDDEIRTLAKSIGRTRWAVYRRMERLRNCSTAPAVRLD